MALYADLDALRASAADVRIVTSDGQTIAAHSYVLASASPVLERMIDGAWRGGRCTIALLGVPSDAVLAFLHLLYASSSPRVAAGQEEVVAAHGPQLLALAHAYRVGWLKRAAEDAVSARLTPGRAADMLKLAGLCDAPRLRVACARAAGRDLAAFEASEGWRFARRHDPALELELLRMLEDADRRRERWARERASREACRQLARAMDSLDRIFAAGDADACSTTVGRTGKACARGYDGDDDATCQGLRLLMRHFAACARKAAPGGCARCKRLLQLFRLHAAVCDRTAEQDKPCRVPLCSHFAARMKTEKADKTWRLLVKKVARARAMAGLADRRVPEVVALSWARYIAGSKWAK